MSITFDDGAVGFMRERGKEQPLRTEEYIYWGRTYRLDVYATHPGFRARCYALELGSTGGTEAQAFANLKLEIAQSIEHTRRTANLPVGGVVD
jgi:hypothetical protein